MILRAKRALVLVLDAEVLAVLVLLIGENLPSILAFLVILVTPLFWIAAWMMWSRHRKRLELRLMRVAAEAATALAVVVTTFALVFLNNGMATPILDSFGTMVVGRSAILVLSIPLIRFLWITRGFG